MAGKHEQIAGSLINDILSGHYRVGERLPSERDLSVRFAANRGAVREAMKKLVQLGVADVQPGGARVKERGEASVDVIGHILSQGSLPDAQLIDQILVVMNSLIGIAAEQAMELATSEQITQIRGLTQPLQDENLDLEEHSLARYELMAAIMQASNNLPLRLIARSLLDQFMPHVSELSQFADAKAGRAAYATFARQLDLSLQQHDLPALRASFAGLSDLNRQTMMRAIEAAQQSLEAVSQ